MQRILVISVMLLLGHVSAAAQAATYYVGQNVAGASDDNDGLAGESGPSNRGPWKTIGKAASVAQAGDRVWVFDGDYRDEDTGWGVGHIAIANSGQSVSQTIRFSAAPGHTPVVESMLIRDKRYIVVTGFHFKSKKFIRPGNWRNMPEIVVDDASVVIDPREPWSTREAKVRRKYATYMSVRDDFESEYRSALDIVNSNYVVVRGNTISGYAFGIQVRDRSDNITIDSNEISFCGDGIFSWQPAPAISFSYIRNNKIRQSFNNGIMIREGANSVVIRDNDVMYSGTSHISVLRDSINNFVYRNSGQFGGYYSETMTYPGSSAFNIHTSGSGNVFDSNYAAYQVDLTGNDGNGYIVDLMRDGGSVLLRNNIAYRNMGSGIRTTESPRALIINNTLAENGYRAVNPRGGSGVGLSRDEDIDNVIINNIFYNNAHAGIKAYRIIDQQRAIEQNMYYSDSGAPFIWDGYEFDERVYSSLDSIRNNTPWERYGVAGDPLFESIDDGNFRPMSNSRAIDRGRKMILVPADADGKSRPQGRWYDIGAYEIR